MRLIDADELNATLKDLGEEGKENWSTDEIKEYIVDYQPTVDAEPVVHAHWEIIEENVWIDDDYAMSGGHPDTKVTYRCPLCGTVKGKKYPRCICGAVMDEEE